MKLNMKTRNVLFLYGAIVLLTILTPSVRAQSPPLLNANLFAGVNITGTAGSVYVIQSATDPAQPDAWRSLAFVQLPATNYLFVDTSAAARGNRFYRALLENPSTNMVFIPAGIFTMGSSTNEPGRNANEGPQTRVILNRGFWMGRYEVTQREYLDVTGANPSVFPGDLSRPVSSVSWPDATNYCGLLTQRELAAGRIPAGSSYRLPTEAEWEYSARAGTSTRFSYGDDPDYMSLTNYAWHFLNAGLTVHPVGEKRPNPWGLFDMHGNVWEWCQDWLGDLPGGTVVDPQGPVENAIGWKVIRGGGYDFSEADCRSARRYFFGSHPALNDSNLGFRVVLACQ
jgi:formylglycine-generating enzyme required for sulfatase activity